MQVTMFLADAANVTANGKLNVLGIFTQVNPPVFPYRHPAMVLVSKIALDVGERMDERTIEIFLMDEDAQRTGIEIKGTIEFQRNSDGSMPEVNLVIQLHNVLLEKPGQYEFVLLVNDDRKHSVSLNVSQQLTQR